MQDYLEIFKKFKDVKEIYDFITDVEKLRWYFSTQQYQQMQQHINDLTQKYFVETILWNVANPDKPTTYQQACINAENFLQVQGAKILVKAVVNYKQYLTEKEIIFLESLIKPVR